MAHLQKDEMSGMPYPGKGWRTNSRLYFRPRVKSWVPYQVWRARKAKRGYERTQFKLSLNYSLEEAREMGLFTFSEWQAKGRRIHKGRKARGFLEGEALFNKGDTYQPRF